MNEALRPATRRQSIQQGVDELDLANVTYKIYEQDDTTGSSYFEIWKKRSPQELMLKIMKKLGITPGSETRTFKIVMCAAVAGKSASKPYSVSYVDLPDDLDKDMSDKTHAVDDDGLDDGLGESDMMLGEDMEGGEGGGMAMAMMMRSAMAAQTKMMTAMMQSQAQQLRDISLARNSGGDVVDTITKVVGAITPLVVPLMERLKPRDEGMKPVELIQMGLNIAQTASQKAVAPTGFDYFSMAAGVASGLGQMVAAQRGAAPAANPPALPPALPAPAPNPTPALPGPVAATPNPAPAPAPAPAAAPKVPPRYGLYAGLGQSVLRNEVRKLQTPSYWAERIICEWDAADLTEFAKAQSEILVAEMGEAFAKNLFPTLPLTLDHAKALAPLLMAVHGAVKAAVIAPAPADNNNKGAASAPAPASAKVADDADESEESDDDSSAAATA